MRVQRISCPLHVVPTHSGFQYISFSVKTGKDCCSLSCHTRGNTHHYTKVIWTDKMCSPAKPMNSAELLDELSSEGDEKRQAQVLLMIKVQIWYFMSALWFVYVPRPWLILLSSKPCLNPEPATHQSQLQFKLPGNGKISLKLVIFSLQLLCLLKPFNSTYTLQRIATQITHSSIGCHILVLFSIGADSQEWNEHQTLFHHSHPLLPSDCLSLPFLDILSISVAFTQHSCSPILPSTLFQSLSAALVFLLLLIHAFVIPIFEKICVNKK